MDDGFIHELHQNDQNQIHRTNGPARIWHHGAEDWHLFGRYHRYYGPAVSWSGSNWILHGKLIKDDGD